MQTPDAALSSFLKPERFDAAVAAVWKRCDYVDCKVKIAIKLGYALCKCCALLVNKDLYEKNLALERDAESVIRLYDTE